MEDSTARVLGAGVDLRYQGRLLPAYESVTVLQGLMDSWPEDNRYKQLLDTAGVTIDDVADACQYLVMAAEPIAEADREKYSLAKAEAEPFYRRFLLSIKETAGRIAGSNDGRSFSDIISDEIEVVEHVIEHVRDLGLDWVACRLQDLGFQNVSSWEKSVMEVNSQASSFNEGDDRAAVAQQATEMTPEWMVSFEEKKKGAAGGGGAEKQ